MKKKRKHSLQEHQMKHTQTVVKIFRSAIVYVQMELR